MPNYLPRMLRAASLLLGAAARGVGVLTLLLGVLAIVPARAAAADFELRAVFSGTTDNGTHWSYSETNVSTASFGPPLSYPRIAGQVVRADDGVGDPTPYNYTPGLRTDDGCEPLVNGAAVAGKIVFVTRGTCAFTIKVKNAQNAGAIAVIVLDLFNCCPGGDPFGAPLPGMGGTDPSIVIPSILVNYCAQCYRPDLAEIGLFDTSPPVITYTVTGTLGSNGWYTSDVGLTWSVSEPQSPTTLDFGALCVDQTITVDQPAQDYRCAAQSEGGQTHSFTLTIKRDATAPTISAAATSSPNANGWYNGPVTVHFSCDDALSGVASCPADETLSSEGSAVSSSAQTASDNAGNSSSSSNVVTVKIDRSGPTVRVTGVTDGASYTLGAPSPRCSTNDALSGVATAATLSLSGTGTGSGVGVVTATCAGASDAAGNPAAAVSVTYSVAYGFSGFSAPVDNTPIVNIANAGRVIPLKWRLTGVTGNPISNLASATITSTGGSCSANTTADTLEEYASSSSGLQNLGNGYYQYNWQTERAWAGGCRTLKLDLGEDQPHVALFQFR